MNLDKPVLATKPKDVTYFKLNNELNRPIDGSIPLQKDREAVRAYFLEFVNPNTVFFYTLDEKLNYLIKEDYIEEEFLNQYDRAFVKELFEDIYSRYEQHRTSDQ